MAQEASPSLEIVYWQDVREKVRHVNSELADIIDEIDPGKKLPFVRARYIFGVNILNRGKFLLPYHKNAVSLEHNSIPEIIRKRLSYHDVPIGLILDKALEVYVEAEQSRIIPFKLFKPGVTFGVWEAMPAPKISMRRGWAWSISSGARTIFMLPKITDSLSYAKLKKAYKIKSYQPASLFEHHAIFSEIASHEGNQFPWYSDILFFTADWFKPELKDRLTKVRLHWAQQAWIQMQQWINKIILEFNWEPLTAELTKRDLKVNSYLLDTLKHLISLGCGTIPGFRVATNDMVAPIKLFQEAYLQEYHLKHYSPLVMHPDHLLSESSVLSVYYSLTMPTLAEKPAEMRNFVSTMKLLKELKLLMDIYWELLQKWPKSSLSSSNDFLERISFSYFHNTADEHDEIKLTSNIINEDNLFMHSHAAFSGKLFPENSHFFRGCVRVFVD